MRGFRTGLRWVGVLGCIALVALLMLASVMPGIHNWLFHGKGREQAPTVTFHGCTEGHPHADTPRPDEPHGPAHHHDLTCPVALFAQGITEPGEVVVMTRPLGAWSAAVARDTSIAHSVDPFRRIRKRDPPDTSSHHRL